MSKTAAKLRIIDAGYEEAMCALTYLDGAYVPPHSFKKGSLKPNETFSISAKEAVIQSLTNPKLYEASKYFTFIENHFVLNHPKYITSTENGTFLTEYARYHMDECALKFTLKTKSDIYTKFYSVYFLNRDRSDDIDFIVSFSGNSSHLSEKEKNELMSAILLEETTVLTQLPNDFTMAWKKIMDWKQVSQAELARRTKMSAKTIGDIINEVSNGSLKSLVAMCIGLNISPEFSDYLISRSPHNFKLSDMNHATYKFVLRVHYMKSLEEVQHILASMNVDPL